MQEEEEYTQMQEEAVAQMRAKGEMEEHLTPVLLHLALAEPPFP